MPVQSSGARQSFCRSGCRLVSGGRSRLSSGSALPGSGHEVGKPGLQCDLQKAERLHLTREILQPELPVRDLTVELILQIDIGRLPRKILVGTVAERDRGSRQDIVHSRLETGVLGFCGFQCVLDRVRDRLKTRLIRLRIARGGTGRKRAVGPALPNDLEHFSIGSADVRDSYRFPKWSRKVYNQLILHRQRVVAEPEAREWHCCGRTNTGSSVSKVCRTVRAKPIAG